MFADDIVLIKENVNKVNNRLDDCGEQNKWIKNETERLEHEFGRNEQERSVGYFIP